MFQSSNPWFHQFSDSDNSMDSKNATDSLGLAQFVANMMDKILAD